jgi:predicted nuclease of restriction endonuclease-like (RecB) superfamily
VENNYYALLNNLKSHIRNSQLRTVIAVNSAMVQLYWEIGHFILKEQEQEGWGAKIIDSLSKDLKMDFPNMKGLSARNLKYMRAFSAAYPAFEIVQQLVAQISWGHNIVLLDKVKNEKIRFWYIEKSIEHGWSRNVMLHQIAANAYEKFGKLPNNFQKALSAEHLELAIHLFKDEYIFDFIAQDNKLLEKDLEQSFIRNITQFLLELGKGFSFVGQQYHISVGGQDFYIDLLFYHLKLRCFIVMELKVGAFKPEYIGKLNFYISAADDFIRRAEDNPTIGLLLCKSKNDWVVEYALRDFQKPMGVAVYKLPNEINETWSDALPTNDEWQMILKPKQKNK